MTFRVKFSEQGGSFRARFGQTHNLSDGGYERGYADGCNDCASKDPWQYVPALTTTFNGAVFPTNYELTLNVPQLSASANINNIIGNAKNLKKLTLKCGRTDITLNSYFAFGSCMSIEEIDLSQFCDTEVVRVKSATYMFYNCTNLKTIRGILDFSACAEFTGTFEVDRSLRDLQIAPESIFVSFSMTYCNSLSDESIQSVIDGLADLTGSTSAKLTFHADVKAKLTEEQLATIAAKNWTLG